MRLINKPMKPLSLYLFLILFTLQTPSQADDISDFQIEGMSLGDNLLDYFNEEEINKPRKYYYKDNKYIGILIYRDPSFKVYDSVSFVYKPIEKYKIYEITGTLFFRYNVKDCYKKQDEIVSELSEEFKNIASKRKYTRNYTIVDGKWKPDKSGKTKTTTVQFTFSNGTIRVYCSDKSEKATKENNWWDALKVEIRGVEFIDFMKIAYK